MYEEKTIEEVSGHFHTDVDRGLSWAEAITRLSADGMNELEEERKKSVPGGAGIKIAEENAKRA